MNQHIPEIRTKITLKQNKIAKRAENLTFLLLTHYDRTTQIRTLNINYIKHELYFSLF